MIVWYVTDVSEITQFTHLGNMGEDTIYLVEHFIKIRYKSYI